MRRSKTPKPRKSRNPCQRISRAAIRRDGAQHLGRGLQRARIAQRARLLRDRRDDHHDARPRRQAARDDRQLLHLGVADAAAGAVEQLALRAEPAGLSGGLAFRRQHPGLRPDRAVEQIRQAERRQVRRCRPHHPRMRRPGASSARRRISSAATSSAITAATTSSSSAMSSASPTPTSRRCCSAAANTCAANRSCRS